MKHIFPCPHCTNLVEVEIGKPGLGRVRGYAKAQATRIALREKECSKEAHKEKSKTMRYCNYCHRTIFFDDVEK